MLMFSGHPYIWKKIKPNGQYFALKKSNSQGTITVKLFLLHERNLVLIFPRKSNINIIFLDKSNANIL